MCQFPFLENLFKCHWGILESNSSNYRWLLLLVLLLERGKRSKFKKTACSSGQPVPSLCHSKPHLVSFRSLLPLPNAGTHPQMPYNCPTKKGEGMVRKFAKSVRTQDPTPFFEKEMQDVLKSPSPQTHTYLNTPQVWKEEEEGKGVYLKEEHRVRPQA